jgi:penicillin amidase
MRKSQFLRRFIKIIKYFIIIFSVALILVGLVIGFYLYNAKSSPNGKAIVSGLRDEVVITFDQSDIPHVEAKSSNDALFSLGYLHARERGWQLEFNRRLASGSLSEIIGEKTIRIDQFIRTLGIRTAARNQFELLPSETKLALEAYTNGINSGFADLGWALPAEFILLGTKPGLWTPIDSMSWMMMMALDLGDNWSKEVIRLQLASILTTEEIWQILPPYLDDLPATHLDFAKMYKEREIYQTDNDKGKTVASNYYQLQDVLPMGQDGKGSNNWVISGDKTISGKPILANDPHLGLSTPSTWYFVHLKSKEMNIIGGSIPGLPGIILGHTPKVAWGFTNTAADVQDLYIDRIQANNPIKYETASGSELFKIRRETISIKGQRPLTILVRETVHGPVISDVYEPLKKLIDTEKFVVSLKWTALDKKNHSILSLLAVNKSNSLEDLKKAFSNFHAPVQNIVMADVDGNFGYMVAGATPKRLKQSGMSGVAPVFGWEIKNEWGPYLTSKDLPQDFSSNLHWIVTANHKVQPENVDYDLTADWTSPYRYDRINQLLQSKTKHDIPSNMDIQADTLSLAATPLIKLFKETVNQNAHHEKVQPLIENFQGDMKINSAGALIFNVWIDQLTQLIFKPKLGIFFEEIYHQKNLREGLIKILSNNDSSWCDDTKTPEIERCADLSPEALNLAMNYLSKRYGTNPSNWTWGQAHPAISQHNPLSKAPLLGKLFELKTPFPGDTFTINVGRVNYGNAEEPYATNLAPGMRVIYDLSNFDQSVFMGIGGQSGWVQSKRYREYLGIWSQNNYLPLSTNIPKTTQGVLLLKAK